MKNTPRPEDFVLNYSPAGSANLLLWEVDERPITSLRSLLRHVRGRLFDANGIEVKRALAEMTDRWGNTSSATIAQFLSDKFSADHLRKFEYAFLTRCIARPDVCKNMIVDIGGAELLNSSAYVVSSDSDSDYIHRRESSYSYFEISRAVCGGGCDAHPAI